MVLAFELNSLKFADNSIEYTILSLFIRHRGIVIFQAKSKDIKIDIIGLVILVFSDMNSRKYLGTRIIE